MQIKVDLPEGIHFKFWKSVMLQFLDEPREKAMLLAGLESQPLDLKARSQVLCYNCCPRKQTKSASAKVLSPAGQGLNLFLSFCAKIPFVIETVRGPFISGEPDSILIFLSNLKILDWLSLLSEVQ